MNTREICEIRPFALFAFQNCQFVKRLCYGHTPYLMVFSKSEALAWRGKNNRKERQEREV